jgi:hypothetical protein
LKSQVHASNRNTIFSWSKQFSRSPSSSSFQPVRYISFPHACRLDSERFVRPRLSPSISFCQIAYELVIILVTEAAPPISGGGLNLANSREISQLFLILAQTFSNFLEIYSLKTFKIHRMGNTFRRKLKFLTVRHRHLIGTFDEAIICAAVKTIVANSK